jgi:hypothetical protein
MCGDGIPKCSYRKAHLPIFAPTQILVEFRAWVCQPLVSSTLHRCSPPLTTGSKYFEGVDRLEGIPIFGTTCSVAPRATEAYHHPSMSLRESNTTQVYNCFKPQNRCASAQRSDKSRFWSRFFGECHEASPSIKPCTPPDFSSTAAITRHHKCFLQHTL